MPTFDDHTHSSAAPEAVWKLLYDPTRFTEWWVGVETVSSRVDDPTYTMYPTGYPDFPMPQTLRADPPKQQVSISCLVSDLQFVWQLGLADDGRSTEIHVHVDIPDAEAARLDAQRDIIHRSLGNLATLAADS
ncbi:SRPBCC family protein [Antrihabitans stalactiti]|uniref:SRPBCC family protein n=1 Tax=Antrihabitans stalactiti TaxID=2584121 RepID=A0A848KBY8_9NOCA|nr:SRPBCC family protein [Antrihabitans stalactiti]NMN95038.1 SRPBCC family protein [Antrihabitans stalactiti]